MRPGDELKLLLPPFDAAPRFAERLELKREGPHLLICATRGGDTRWQVGVELPHLPHQKVQPMPPTEFSRLTNEGALAHPMGVFMHTPAHLALFALTQTVPGATEALRGWAVERDRQDQDAAAMEEGGANEPKKV